MCPTSLKIRICTMANQLATHSLSDPRLQRLDLDVRAAAQSRSSLLINGERDEALLVARLAHELGVTYCTTSHFVVVGPDVLSEGLSHFPMASSSQERRGRQSRASEERWTLCVEDVDQLPPLGQKRLMGFLDVVCASEGALHALWVIATATTTLETRVASKDFLRELYYRLNVVHILLSDARTASPSALDCLTTEVGKRTEGGPTQLSPHRLHELLASERLHDPAQLQPLLTSV